ncbi:hypothetical protein VP06_14550 [Methylobacterium aquaticum]|uniref:Uncharacterized protein n=1 Tax=Methylobacterium aquaticum TaxID=270351 RepID=A0A0J6SGD6_9HYPH|nr:hypothetical protein VP06_14550 [Methylobacterium aquaticum]
MSEAEKARRTQEKEDRAAQNRASAAVERFPEDKEKRLELFQERDALVTESHGVSGKMSAHQKRMREVFGHHPMAVKIRDAMLKARPGEREAIVAQVRLMLEDAGCEVQFDLFHSQPGKPSEQDNGSVFDRGAAGERQGQEQFDPARAQKAATETAPEPAPTPGIPLDEAEKVFTKNLAAAEARKEKGKGGRKAKVERTPADEIREGTAEADAVLKEQIAKSAKPGRGRKPKAANTDAPDDPPPAAAAPDIDDDLGDLDDPPAAPLHANDPLPGATNHGDYRIAS